VSVPLPQHACAPGDPVTVARECARAADAVTAAHRELRAAAAVEWDGPAATAFRREVAALDERLLRHAVAIDEALAAAKAAVRPA